MKSCMIFLFLFVTLGNRILYETKWKFRKMNGIISHLFFHDRYLIGHFLSLYHKFSRFTSSYLVHMHCNFLMQCFFRPMIMLIVYFTILRIPKDLFLCSFVFGPVDYIDAMEPINKRVPLTIFVCQINIFVLCFLSLLVLFHLLN